MLAPLGLVVRALIEMTNRKASADYQSLMDMAQAVASGLIGLYCGARL